MIRPATLSLLVVAGLAGGLFFHVSYGARALDEKLMSQNRQIKEHKDEIHVLRADWSYLNEPARLEDLSRRHLGLAPISHSQVIKMEMLPMREITVVIPITDRPLIEKAIHVVPKASIISVGASSVTVMPQPKPSAPKRVTAGHELQVAPRSLDDVVTDLLLRKSAR